jgi:hypothetical protein
MFDVEEDGGDKNNKKQRRKGSEGAAKYWKTDRSVKN